MRPTIAVALITVAVLGGLPSAANAATTRCSGHDYWLIDRDAFPSIGKLRATNLPRLTSDYAPRCLVAEAVAGLVQDGFRFYDGKAHFPRRVHPRGARWNGGRYRCRYRDIQSQGDVVGQRAACQRGKRVIRMNLGS